MKILLAVLLAASAVNAAAAVFSVPVNDKSSITFTSRQMGVPVNGSFRNFATAIVFDPARPQASRARIDVKLASIDAGSSDADDTVKSALWFDVKDYPDATFVSDGLTASGGNRYLATGKLTIKGRSRPVTVPFTATSAGTLLVLDGAIPVSRKQYGIGGGVWADPSVVADAVAVRFHLVLAPANK